MATSPTSHARSRRGASKLRVKIRRGLASRFRARGESRRPRVTLFNMGFFVLVVSTTWVIASVSMWWVPFYVVLLLTIFVVPRRGRLLPSASETGAEIDDVSIADLEPGLRVDRADGVDQGRPQSRTDSFLTDGESTESSIGTPNPSAAGTPKPRRSRAQVRKSVLASERDTRSVPVVWVQTGPGKFVRVEGGLPAANSAEIADDSLRAYPVTDIPAAVIEAEPTQAALPAAQNPPKSVWANPPDIEQSCVSDNPDSGSVSEEYGIAPSAFSLNPEVNASVERSELDHPGQVCQTDAPVVVFADASRELPSDSEKPGHRLRRQGVSRRWVLKSTRDLGRAVPRAGRGSPQRATRTALSSRILVGSWFAPNAPRQLAVRRDLGRMCRLPRDLRSRSPPSCSRDGEGKQHEQGKR